MRKYTGAPPKKDRTWLRACLDIVKDRHERVGGSRTRGTLNGGRKPTMAMGRTPNKRLLRRRITQGPPFKCPMLRELLWDWFVDMRRSIAANISPKYMLMKARSIGEMLLPVMKETGMYSPMPKIDKHWLYRFKRDKGIVYRLPNTRYKCSKAVLTTRLRAMWVNAIKVRRLAQRLLGSDLSQDMYGIDEKPLHFNEGGSKCVRTLELAGAPSVRLKENHAATRERVSVMTTTSSNQAAIDQPGGLPVPVPKAPPHGNFGRHAPTAAQTSQRKVGPAPARPVSMQ